MPSSAQTVESTSKQTAYVPGKENEKGDKMRSYTAYPLLAFAPSSIASLSVHSPAPF
jgi:hypothetical protein